MGVTERGFTGIDVDVILENCTITFVIRIERKISTRLVI